jgi:hypothetical protein
MQVELVVDLVDGEAVTSEREDLILLLVRQALRTFGHRNLHNTRKITAPSLMPTARYFGISGGGD